MSKYNYAVQDYDGEITFRVVKPEVSNMRGVLWWPRTGKHSYYEIVYRPKGIRVVDWTSRIVDLNTHNYKIENGLLTAVPKGHIHAEKMMLYAEDAKKHSNPWELWQYKYENGIEFHQCETHPQWKYGREYRRTPETININGYDVPKPIYIDPKQGTKYYFVCFGKGNELIWFNTDFDRILLANGLIHDNAEAAALHIKALVSFTKEPL